MFPSLGEEKGNCPSPVVFTQPMEPFPMLDELVSEEVVPEILDYVMIYPNLLVVGDYSFSHSAIQVSKYTECELIVEYPGYIVTIKCPREQETDYYHFTKIARLIHYERAAPHRYGFQTSTPGCGGKVEKKA
jgi:hypothetical protein